MHKTLKLALNQFPVTPESLRHDPAVDVPKDVISIDLARLFHHYYLDTRGCVPPDPDPAQFEHVGLLLSTSELRVKGDGFGVGTAFRRHRSNELGQAFCRWFLYEHMNITYFAHIEDVVNKQTDARFGGLRVERVQAGDIPDYFCAKNYNQVHIAEAKGRMSAVSFSNSEFGTWRNQFNRVAVKNRAGQQLSVKGFIVATRFATESNRSSVKSTLYAEDPETPGEEPIEAAGPIGARVIDLHYSAILAKLRQPLASLVLAQGDILPEELLINGVVWEFRAEPLKGRRFVGGYFHNGPGAAPIQIVDQKIEYPNADPFRLDVASGTFFGLEESIFLKIVARVRGGESEIDGAPRVDDVQPFYSGISFLRDGSILGPVEFFQPVNLIQV